MKLYPSANDRVPLGVRNYVQTELGNIVPTDVVYELPETVERRLGSDFPVYKALQAGKRVVAQVIGGAS